jgi:hypothetical protein
MPRSNDPKVLYRQAERAAVKATKAGALVAKLTPTVKKLTEKVRPLQKALTQARRIRDSALYAEQNWKREARFLRGRAKDIEARAHRVKAQPPGPVVGAQHSHDTDETCSDVCPLHNVEG